MQNLAMGHFAKMVGLSFSSSHDSIFTAVHLPLVTSQAFDDATSIVDSTVSAGMLWQLLLLLILAILVVLGPYQSAITAINARMRPIGVTITPAAMLRCQGLSVKAHAIQAGKVQIEVQVNLPLLRGCSVTVGRAATTLLL